MPTSTTSPAFSTLAAIGEATCVGLKSARWMARLLQNDGRGYWPTPGPGRPLRVGVDDVNNLVVALECSPRLAADGPRIVAEFRALKAVREQEIAIQRDMDGRDTILRREVPLLPRAPDLAEWMDAWLNGLVHPDQIEHPLGDARRQQPVIRFKLTTPLTALVMLERPDGSGLDDLVEYAVPADADTWGDDVQVSKLAHTEVVIRLPQMEALADILRRAYVPDLLSGSGEAPDGGGDTGNIPEKKKAAPGANPSGLLEYPTPQAQATPRDLAVIEDSLPEQEGSKQLPPSLSGPGSRVRHRHAIRRGAEPRTRGLKDDAYRHDAAAP